MSSSDRLPATLRRVIAYSGVGAESMSGRAELTQVGKMWRAPDARPLAFTATQWIEAASMAFSWRARFPLLPGFPLHITDAFENAQGRLEGRLWGWLKLFRQTGPEIDRGEVYRYLAELPWAPAAYTANRALTWEERGSEGLRVSCEMAGRTLRLDFHVDHAGRITSARAEDRPDEVNGAFVERPWTGRFDNWQRLGGVMIPTEAEVAWETTDGPFTYWRGTVTTYTLKGAV